ncbi:N-acetylglucosamine-6-phosphate deacetylase [Serinibacter arcticus]|uniref:N-acetylglucosamine-6-phosphate deacetylase n=1 Tax=Serinibacter arcticus TaxID=1655435 RepID=A0A2U1ZUV8_9MICO|nr:N-acetylglucosamine-6-phosphate deacetylase [Serinibacter arcticus]PWD50758.1 N-acetylglucosamine-6-phosphate deacetylase [Serinibacter arcticus]
MLVRAERALVDGALVGPVLLEVDGGRIRAVVVDPERVATATPDVDLAGGTLTPGLLDLQVNGSFGADFADATPQEWAAALDGLASRGITGIEPTIITAPIADLHGAFDRTLAARRRHEQDTVTRILGAHLEGPFLSPERKGAHRADWMLDPSREHLDALLANPATREVLLTVTLAPELPGALAAIERLAGDGVVVSVGHSDATAAQVHAAADAGATMVTHLFNAQRPLNHREPGVVGAALADERLFVGTIADAQHVDASVVGIVAGAARGRMVAVTDAIVTAGLPNHTWLTFGGDEVANDATGLGRRRDGTIAGAGIVLDEGVRRLVAAGLDPAVVLTACTEVPARSIRRDDVGRLAVGTLADLVWWDAAWHPERVWIGGVERDTA